jgi:putative membrane protein insertion efficiency factor
MITFFQSSNIKTSGMPLPEFRANNLGRAAIVFYQATFSFFLGGNCRYYPSCSHYGVEAFSKYGFWEALKLTVLRLASCHPFSKKAFFDPLPTHYLEKSSK